MTKPISPEEVSDEKLKQIPPEVIEAFNFLIAQKYNPDSKSSRVLQDDVITEIGKRIQIERAEIFNLKYLDVEDIYRREGWIVTYDKPAYNESYDASFIFRKPLN